MLASLEVCGAEIFAFFIHFEKADENMRTFVVLGQGYINGLDWLP